MNAPTVQASRGLSPRRRRGDAPGPRRQPASLCLHVREFFAPVRRSADLHSSTARSVAGMLDPNFLKKLEDEFLFQRRIPAASGQQLPRFAASRARSTSLLEGPIPHTIGSCFITFRSRSRCTSARTSGSRRRRGGSTTSSIRPARTRRQLRNVGGNSSPSGTATRRTSRRCSSFWGRPTTN